jgi:hypothetical protein
MVPTGQIFIEFDMWEFFENLCRKFKFYYNWTINTDTLHENQYIFFVIFPSVFNRKKNDSDEICRENHSRHFTRIFNNLFPESPAVREKNVELYGIARQITDDNIVSRMLFECCITKAIDTHLEYILLIAFLWQNCLHKRAPYSSILYFLSCCL